MPVPHETLALTRRSARDEVYDQLRDWIEQGVLERGEQLRDQEIAEALGVSRTPVREALQKLEQLGVIETIAGRHTRVRDVAPAEVERVYPPLAVLLGLAAELAADQLSPAELDEMEQLNERMLACTQAGDPQGAREADLEFHGVLVRVAANPYIERSLEPLLLHQRWLAGLYFSHERDTRASYHDHREILAALRGGAGDRAFALTRRNAERVRSKDPS
jgi:DNA-binding GntR family transcriptional regulator